LPGLASLLQEHLARRKGGFQSGNRRALHRAAADALALGAL
jgi:hypothetical protein